MISCLTAEELRDIIASAQADEGVFLEAEIVSTEVAEHIGTCQKCSARYRLLLGDAPDPLLLFDFDENPDEHLESGDSKYDLTFSKTDEEFPALQDAYELIVKVRQLPWERQVLLLENSPKYHSKEVLQVLRNMAGQEDNDAKATDELTALALLVSLHVL